MSSLSRGRILITSPPRVFTTMLLPTASNTSTESVFLHEQGEGGGGHNQEYNNYYNWVVLCIFIEQMKYVKLHSREAWTTVLCFVYAGFYWLLAYYWWLWEHTACKSTGRAQQHSSTLYKCTEIECCCLSLSPTPIFFYRTEKLAWDRGYGVTWAPRAWQWRSKAWMWALQPDTSLQEIRGTSLATVPVHY